MDVYKLSSNAIVPSRGSPHAAGYDLYSAEDIIVPPRDRSLIKTDIAIAVPTGHYGRIAPRSGLSLKSKLDIGGGVVDEDYRGNVGVILINNSDNVFHVHIGDRIAQLILEKIITPVITEATSMDELGDTERGDGGFGSTGMGV